MKKIGNISVKVGEYTKDGQTKGRYENAGALLQDDEGKFLVTIKKTFNPAGVTTVDGRDSVLMTVYQD